jgi:two-component sensor histidine kinase
VALNLGLVLHELGTNAQKHGALSVPSGCVQLSWAVRKEDKKSVLEMSWSELGGPPVRPPEARGFGMALIERTIGGTVEGEAKIRFDPEGLHCLIELPLR